MHPCKRICDITGFEAPYYDPRTNLRYANAEVFKAIRSLPNDYVQRYLALRDAAVAKWNPEGGLLSSSSA
ncbi:hypothetical protein RJ639_017693 [Escallonia herrerae]|uniref:Vps72/YL1 C-terminal domain-containing protein n=1 Tax=Escallonia herrerae TaxID=1293975 RepID=A0AA89ALV0_9ASTE|nr:hypothetical protein RJ639_017693 [Escallonia herrerae]